MHVIISWFLAALNACHEEQGAWLTANYGYYIMIHTKTELSESSIYYVTPSFLGRAHTQKDPRLVYLQECMGCI